MRSARRRLWRCTCGRAACRTAARRGRWATGTGRRRTTRRSEVAQIWGRSTPRARGASRCWRGSFPTGTRSSLRTCTSTTGSTPRATWRSPRAFCCAITSRWRRTRRSWILETGPEIGRAGCTGAGGLACLFVGEQPWHGECVGPGLMAPAATYERRRPELGCGCRRMNDTAAHLVERVIPDEVPVRQWVLSLPHRYRFLIAKDVKLLQRVVGVFVRVVFALLGSMAKAAGVADGKPGAVCALQKFGD